MSSNMEFPHNSVQREEDVSDYSQDCLVNSKVQELYQTFQRLKQFLSQLQQLKAEEFEKEIIMYSDKEFVLSKLSQEILKLCEKRIQKMLRNKKTKKNWNQNDIDILVWVLNKYTTFYSKKSVHSLDQSDWKFISSLIPATSWRRCMFKWLSLKKFSLMAFKWSKEESELLASLVKKIGKKDWKKLSEQLYLSNNSSQKIFRTPKQCRQHWNCYANPLIKKGPWSVKEDIKLLESVLQLNCMKKWSQVAKGIKGRTQNAVKNRFSLLLQKQKKQTGQQNEKHLINRILFNLINQQSRHLQMKSQQFELIKVPNQIFQSDSHQKFSKGDQCQQKRTSIQIQQQKKPQKNKSNIVIPTFIHNEPIYQQPGFFPICQQFTPYFINFIYGGHYQIN